MQIDNDYQLPTSLIERLQSRVSTSKQPQILAVYLTTLVSEIEATSKKSIDSLPNLYVYVYSTSKSYIKRKDPKMESRLEQLFEFFHICIYSCYEHDSAKTLALLRKDGTLEQLLVDDFQTYCKLGKIAKYIFSIFLLWIKAQNENDSEDNLAFGRVADLICQASLSDEVFLRTQALKLVSRLLDSEVSRLSAFLTSAEVCVMRILESWFVKARELPRVLDLLHRILHHFPEATRISVIGRLLEVALGKCGSQVRTKVFIIIESVFAKSYFPRKFTEETIRSLNKTEEDVVELLDDKKVAFAFSRARLQVILNYYAVY
jgi:hypothetical protein